MENSKSILKSFFFNQTKKKGNRINKFGYLVSKDRATVISNGKINLRSFWSLSKNKKESKKRKDDKLSVNIFDEKKRK